MHHELHLPAMKWALGAPAALGLLLAQTGLSIPDAPPWALQLGIVGVGLFFAGLFYVFKYFPWIQECKLRAEQCDAERELHARAEQRRQWDALERMTTAHADAIKAIATAHADAIKAIATAIKESKS